MVCSLDRRGSTKIKTSDRNNSFGFARFIAAGGVIFSHHFALSGFVEPNIAGVTVGAVSVRLFFLMSGFLIFNSLSRNADPFRFCSARVLRILPNLLFALAGTSLITCLAYSNFDHLIEHLRYVAQNVAMLLRGGPMYNVSGIWEQLPYPVLNGSIWSLPYEVWCYIVLFMIMWFSRNSARLVLAVLVVCCVALVLLPGVRLFPLAISSNKLGSLAIWFLAGSLCASYGKQIPFIGSPLLARFENAGDPSYGMYILAWPVQQACIISVQNFWLSMALSALMIIALGYMTWHAFEKRALSRVTELTSWMRSNCNRFTAALSSNRNWR
jgi:peptidoglycan/LPS O-acetylase OafA/YrhL